MISRLTLIVSEGAAELGNGLSWVTVRLQTPTGNQNHPLRWPIRFVAISFQPREVCRSAGAYANSRVLHQPGEKPQVTRSRRYRNSVPDLRAAAI